MSSWTVHSPRGRFIGGDGEAFLAIEAIPGFSVSRERTGAAVSDAPADYRGSHGYLPERPEMRATMLFVGPKLAPSTLQAARLVELTPTWPVGSDYSWIPAMGGHSRSS